MKNPTDTIPDIASLEEERQRVAAGIERCWLDNTGTCVVCRSGHPLESLGAPDEQHRFMVGLFRGWDEILGGAS